MNGRRSRSPFREITQQMPLWPQGGNGYDCRARLLFPRDTGEMPPQAHAHTITHQFETLYDANVQISNGGPYGNLSHLSQTNSLRTGVKHSRQCWLWSLKLCYCSRRYCSKLMYLVKSCWKKWGANVCANVQFSLRLLINYLLTLHNSSLTIGPRHE